LRRPCQRRRSGLPSPWRYVSEGDGRPQG
jgi:hypothetical protein